MFQHLAAYGLTAAFFLAVDYLWLTRIARRFYVEQLGPMLLDPPRLGVAAAFYALYVVGIVYFAVSPALKADALRVAVINGGLFGFLAYATYDLTNYATLKGWPLSVALADMAWGTALTASAATFGYLATRWLLGPAA